MSGVKVLLVTPPMTQLNTPYPATAYLRGFLKKYSPDTSVAQVDASIDLALRLVSSQGLGELEGELKKETNPKSLAIQHFLENAEHQRAVAKEVIRFLQGLEPSLANRIVCRRFLPEGPRFAQHWEEAQTLGDENFNLVFGTLGLQDRARFYATLWLEEIFDAIRDGIDPSFEISRYGEKLAASQASFDPLLQTLQRPPSWIDRCVFELAKSYCEKYDPQIIAITAPFPGNILGAFQLAQAFRNLRPEIQIFLGGGYANTELRELSDPRVFDFFDAITLDDGERPLLSLIEAFTSKKELKEASLLRTWIRVGSQVVLKSDPTLHDIPHSQAGTPQYDGLQLQQYLSLIDVLNPMHRIWSDGRWNKITLAHGCYWKKCNFCDVTLDYIGRYDPAAADVLIDRIIEMKESTGQSGFHFVDEAAPPALLKSLAQRLIEREVVISWWGNIRFEKSFTPELCELLATSGCIAVSGGLEVASDRLLKLMNKGVSVEQVARVTRAFSDAGILVHAYLMYGFPTQTQQETVDALERVRQLFENGCVQSAYWHRFSATVHSPIGKSPEKFGIRIIEKEPRPSYFFARNDLPFEDTTGIDHSLLGPGLNRALYNYMRGAGLDLPVQEWFRAEFKKAPKTTVPRNLVAKALASKAT